MYFASMLLQRGKIPIVDEYNVTTKTGAHSFYEIMKAKLTLPDDPTRKSMVGPTVPKPLQSEAIWTNGALTVIVKEIGMTMRIYVCIFY